MAGTTAATAQTDSACFRIVSPLSGQVLKNPYCTLSIANCEDILNVTFRATYLSSDAMTSRVAVLGRLTRPPFKVVWNADSLPNQDFTGLTVHADILKKNGEMLSLRQEGVFLLHQEINAPSLTVPHYDPQFDKAPLSLLKLSGAGSVSGTARVAWNKKGVIVFIRIQDPLFYGDMPKEMLGKLGCELLFDRSKKGLPYPGDSLISIDIPLEGEPLLKRYTTTFDPIGTYRIETVSKPFTGQFTIERFVGKGWTLRCIVDREQLGQIDLARPLRCNLIARVSVTTDTVTTQAWIGGTYAQQHSPIRFGVLRFQPRPWTSNPWLYWVAAFLVGFAVALVVTLLLTDTRPKGGAVARFELTEEEKYLVEKVRELVERSLTSAELNVASAASQLDTDPRKLNKLLKKYLSQTFDTYLARSRVEIAKERLRSSNSSEKAIALMCGFASVTAMEKAFKTLYKITPYNYRMKQQVT